MIAFTLALLLQAAPPAPVTTDEAQFLRKTYASMPCRLLVPRNYDAKKRYPLLVYLHGGGGIGTDNARQLRGGNGQVLDLFVRQAKAFPSFILVPQSSGEGWADRAQLAKIPNVIAAAQKEYRIDPRRIYLGGQSLGGFATYVLVAARPDLFAAAFVLSGSGDPASASKIARVPFWILHGSADRIVPVDRAYKMRDAIRGAGGLARYTEFRGEGHQIWPHVDKELVSWLFTQLRR
ncbi:MAG TPA: prolyl oligopeptidase family serine peptidase [Thermoanaerobaculia bacterium]|nr:prolyl oligopeptidase family serine peptidase [Thermoanaerobaculia bacterium]